MNPMDQRLSPAKQRLLDRLVEQGREQSVKSGLGAADAYIVPLRTEGSKPPLFVIHPIMGVVFPYHSLVSQLAPGRPVFGIQSFDSAGRSQPHASMERIAARYVTELRKVQPAGPYFLAGWSFGSMAAYEMARQLSRTGEEIGALILLDTWAPGAGSVADFLRFSISVSLDIWPFCAEYFRLRFTRSADGARAPEIGPVLKAYWLNSVAVMRYKPGAYPGALSLIRTVKHPGTKFAHPDWGWKQFARGGVEVRYIPGNHMELLRPPHVTALAAEMRSLLSE
jgi:thioesterase domain-containing protein